MLIQTGRLEVCQTILSQCAWGKNVLEHAWLHAAANTLPHSKPLKQI